MLSCKEKTSLEIFSCTFSGGNRTSILLKSLHFILGESEPAERDITSSQNLSVCIVNIRNSFENFSFGLITIASVDTNALLSEIASFLRYALLLPKIMSPFPQTNLEDTTSSALPYFCLLYTSPS